MSEFRPVVFGALSAFCLESATNTLQSHANFDRPVTAINPGCGEHECHIPQGSRDDDFVEGRGVSEPTFRRCHHTDHGFLNYD